MEFVLRSEEVRVLGSLIEKEIATPEYYPMTLHALVAACNQKSNRDPVVEYDEQIVRDAIEGLRFKGLVAEITGVGLRVPKYRGLMTEILNLGRRETAILCVFMLRGPQTLGEIRERASRLHEFTDTEEVESVLNRLVEGGFVTRLSRRPGTREPRYAHLLSGPVESAGAPETASASGSQASRQDRIAALEADVQRLSDELESLKEQFARFRSQFE